MSAAEKLKALDQDVATIREVLTEALACDALDRIAAALPQIVAVVEAAEEYRAIDWDVFDRSGYDEIEERFDAALAALDEALS